MRAGLSVRRRSPERVAAILTSARAGDNQNQKLQPITIIVRVRESSSRRHLHAADPIVADKPGSGNGRFETAYRRLADRAGD